MSSAEPITVFVCGPRLCGEQLAGVVARQGALVWEGGSTPAPQLIEPILAVQHVWIEGIEGLVVLMTDAGLYLTTVDDLTHTSAAGARPAIHAQGG